MNLYSITKVAFMIVLKLIVINADSASTLIHASLITEQVEVYKLEEFILHQECIEHVHDLR